MIFLPFYRKFWNFNFLDWRSVRGHLSRCQGDHYTAWVALLGPNVLIRGFAAKPVFAEFDQKGLRCLQGLLGLVKGHLCLGNTSKLQSKIQNLTC